MTDSNRSTTPDGKENNLPLWRKHFPIDAAADAAHSRREFVGGLAVAGGAMLCGQVALNTLAPVASATSDGESTFEELPPLLLAKNLSELKDGEAELFHYPDHKSPCLLIRFASDDVVAFSQKCTHLACPVIPDLEAERLQCPCHKGSFDIRNGQAVAGPPRKPLPTIRLQFADDGSITATGIEHRA